jgi:hypothetical protein
MRLSRHTHRRLAFISSGLLVLQALLLLHLALDPHRVQISGGRLIHVHGPAVPTEPDEDHSSDEECPFVGFLDLPRLVSATCLLVLPLAPALPVAERDRACCLAPRSRLYLLAPSTSPPPIG